jgi:hypothetical protein
MAFIKDFEVSPTYDVFMDYCEATALKMPGIESDEDEAIMTTWYAMMETIAWDLYVMYWEKDNPALRYRFRCLVTRVLKYAVSYLLEEVEKRATKKLPAVIPKVDRFHSISPWGLYLYVKIPSRDEYVRPPTLVRHKRGRYDTPAELLESMK